MVFSYSKQLIVDELANISESTFETHKSTVLTSDPRTAFSRLLGLATGETATDPAAKKAEVSSVAPCVGLCHVERVQVGARGTRHVTRTMMQEMEKDPSLKTLNNTRKRCVGLCYILRCGSR